MTFELYSHFVSLNSIPHNKFTHISKSWVAMLYLNGISPINILLDILSMEMSKIKFANS